MYRRLQKIEARLRRIEEAAQALLDADAQWVMADCKDLPQARAAVVHAKVALREVLDANGGAPVGRDPAQQTPFQTVSGETTA